MDDYFDRLTNFLLSVNSTLTCAQARTWVELLWGDFEATYAKTGQYFGEEMTEYVVKKWIKQYGEHLHEFVATNPRYAQLLNQNHLTH